jgi:hypothetical protein
MTTAQLVALVVLVALTGVIAWLLRQALAAGAPGVAALLAGILAMISFAVVLWFGAVFGLGIKPHDLVDIYKHGSENGGQKQGAIRVG